MSENGRVVARLAATLSSELPRDRVEDAGKLGVAALPRPARCRLPTHSMASVGASLAERSRRLAVVAHRRENQRRAAERAHRIGVCASREKLLDEAAAVSARRAST